MRFSRQEYWSGLPFPSPGDLSDPGIELGAPALQAGATREEESTRELVKMHTLDNISDKYTTMEKSFLKKYDKVIFKKLFFL